MPTIVALIAEHIRHKSWDYSAVTCFQMASHCQVNVSKIGKIK